MSLEKGFKFKGYFYDSEILSKMTYDELDLLMSNVNLEIKETSEFIFPFSEQLKNRKEVPESVTKKLKYKDALVYFFKDLKEVIHSKKMSIERAFFQYCKNNMDEEEFNRVVVEAEKLSIGE